jgi:hypothetical protein
MSEHPADCILRVLDSLLLDIPLPFHQLRDRFPLGVPPLLELIGERLALSLQLVCDFDARLLFEKSAIALR